MKERTRNFYQHAVRTAAGRIAGGLDESLDLTALAGLACLSPLHFHRIFRGMLGETPLELHRRLRLERAAHRLVTSDQKVTTIAFEAGFETHESFTRAFQAGYGLAPSQYRRRMKDHGALMGARPERLPINLPAMCGLHYRCEGDAEAAIRFAGGEPPSSVSIVEADEVRLAALIHVGPRNLVGSAFRSLSSLLGAGATAVAVFLDDTETTPVSELRTAAGLKLPAGAPIPEGLTEFVIRGGRYVRSTVHGSYAGLPDGWDRLMGQWLPASGERAADRLSYEHYRIADHAMPASMETDLYAPLAGRSARGAPT